MEKKRNYSGAIKDKERTKLKLLKAVGDVFKEYGFNGLTMKRVVERAGVDRRLIYDYFGGFDTLVETYLRGKDYWYGFSGGMEELVADNQETHARQLAQTIVLNQLENFYQNEELQQIIRWQLSENSPVMHDLCIEREKIGSELFKLTDPFFEGSTVDLRAVVALLIGGIYSMVLHAKTAQTTFCEIDLNSDEGMERIRKALSKIIEGAYRAAEEQKKK